MSSLMEQYSQLMDRVLDCAAEQ